MCHRPFSRLMRTLCSGLLKPRMCIRSFTVSKSFGEEMGSNRLPTQGRAVFQENVSGHTHTRTRTHTHTKHRVRFVLSESTQFSKEYHKRASNFQVYQLVFP